MSSEEVETPVGQGAMEGQTDKKTKVIYKFCDLSQGMVSAWREQFKDYIPEHVQVYHGDIFKEGPAADAIVSPANSFGFMDGGIDMAYSRHFGWQMQTRLQKLIREEYHGELLVGEAVIIPAMDKSDWKQNAVNWAAFNEGQPINYLISAPTMRVPCDVSATANAYLAFRGIILSVEKFNQTAEEPIRSVLCPGLGTMVGRMPPERCAFQMLQAYETFVVGLHNDRLCPQYLEEELTDHFNLSNFGSSKSKSQLGSSKSSQKSSKIQELSAQLQKTNVSDG